MGGVGDVGVGGRIGVDRRMGFWMGMFVVV